MSKPLRVLILETVADDALLLEREHEIAHTDTLDFKAMLKRRRETVRKFLEKLPDAATITV
jgi:hypothetical protein